MYLHYRLQTPRSVKKIKMSLNARLIYVDQRCCFSVLISLKFDVSKCINLQSMFVSRLSKPGPLMEVVVVRDLDCYNLSHKLHNWKTSLFSSHL